MFKAVIPESLKTEVEQINKVSGTKEDPFYVRKGLEVYKEPDFVSGEKAVISYITTGAVDRDGDIVKPDGVDLTHYLKHPVVLFGHKYSEMPIGRAAWIKTDVGNKGLVAKTIYANTPQADLIYNYRKEGFPLAVSIGFVPTSYVQAGDISKKDEFAAELKNAVKMGWVDEKKTGSVKTIIQKWSLLEFSDVPVPCNAEALQVACSKGLISQDEVKKMLGEEVKVEETKIVKVIETKTEENSIKTNTPPVMKSIVDVKKLDKKGNPSVRDIKNALYAAISKMNKEKNEIEYFYIEDLFPVTYPDGHCICCCSISENSSKYVDYTYKYDLVTKLVAVGEGVEMDATWLPAKKDLGNREALSKYITSLSLEQVKALPDTEEFILDKALFEDNGKYYRIILDETGKLYKSFVSDISISEKALNAKVEAVAALEVQCKEAEKYKNTRINIAEKSFSNLSSVEPKNREEWEKLYSKWLDFFLTALPGKDVIKEFCEAEKVFYKGITEEPKKEAVTNDLSKEQLITLMTDLVNENNKSIGIVWNEALAKMLGKVQL